MGTALFAKVYRIVTKWYGAPAHEAFEDAVFAYKTGWFDGKQVSYEPDPGETELAEPQPSERGVEPAEQGEQVAAEKAAFEGGPFRQREAIKRVMAARKKRWLTVGWRP